MKRDGKDGEEDVFSVSRVGGGLLTCNVGANAIGCRHASFALHPVLSSIQIERLVREMNPGTKTTRAVLESVIITKQKSF